MNGHGKQEKFEEFLDRIDEQFEGRKEQEVYMIIGGAVALIIFLFGYFVFPAVGDYKEENFNRYTKLTQDVQKLERDIREIKRKIVEVKRKIEQDKKEKVVLEKTLNRIEELTTSLSPLQFNIQKWIEFLSYIADTTKTTGLKFARLSNVIYAVTPEKKGKKGEKSKINKEISKLRKKMKKNIKKVKIAVEDATGARFSQKFLVPRMDLNLTGGGPYKNVVDFIYNLEKRVDLVRVKGFSMDQNKTFQIQLEVYGFKK
jgi:cell division protein FtsB